MSKFGKVRLTRVGMLHTFRLVFRSLLLLAGIWYYISLRLSDRATRLQEALTGSFFLGAVWVIFAVEMFFRFFPSPFESPGCQKQFAGRFRSTGKSGGRVQDNNATVVVALVWITLNGILGALRINGILDDVLMVLICLVYSVCDIICILFFCPFQSWFLHNKCCVTCRIYNWDYAMMFTPLFFVRGWYSISLLALAVGLLIRWEITFWRHPERFSEEANAYLSCAGCTEKLCRHKTQLQKLWAKIR